MQILQENQELRKAINDIDSRCMIMDQWLNDKTLTTNCLDAFINFSKITDDLITRAINEVIPELENSCRMTKSFSHVLRTIFRCQIIHNRFKNHIITLMNAPSIAGEGDVDESVISIDDRLKMDPSQVFGFLFNNGYINYAQSPLDYDSTYHDAFMVEGDKLYIRMEILVKIINNFYKYIKIYTKNDIMKQLISEGCVYTYYNCGRLYNTRHIHVASRPDISKTRFVCILINKLT